MDIELDSKPRACFEVEKVIGVSSDGSYQVQWAPTWVSKFHLVGCEHLIQEFLLQQAEEKNEDGYKFVIPDTSDGSDLISHTAQVNNRMDNDHHEPVALIEQQSEVISWENGGKNSTYFFSSSDSLNDISDGQDQPEELDEGNTSALPSSSKIVVEIEDDEDEDEENGENGNKEEMVEQHSLLANLPSCATSTQNPADGQKEKTKEILHAPIISESQLKTILQASTIEQSKLRKCPVCAQFYLRSSMKRHLRTHTGVKPFVCDICNKSFTQKGSLKGHMRIHTGQKPFQCPNCSETFTQSTYWKYHHARCSSNGGIG